MITLLQLYHNIISIVFESRLYFTTRDYFSADIVSDIGACYLFIVYIFSSIQIYQYKLYCRPS